MSRSFTAVRVSDVHGIEKGKANLGGRFKSPSPASAARKIAKKICAKSAVKGQCALNVHVMETTRGSKHKVFNYQVNRKKSRSVVSHGGRKVAHKYKLVAKSLGEVKGEKYKAYKSLLRSRSRSRSKSH